MELVYLPWPLGPNQNVPLTGLCGVRVDGGALCLSLHPLPALSGPLVVPAPPPPAAQVRKITRLFPGMLRVLYNAAGQVITRCQAVVDMSADGPSDLKTFVADNANDDTRVYCGCSPADRRVLPPESPTFNWTTVAAGCPPNKGWDIPMCAVNVQGTVGRLAMHPACAQGARAQRHAAARG